MYRPWLDAKKATSLPRLQSAVMRYGQPVIFMTTNPGERYSPLGLLYAGTEIDIEDFVPETVPYLERMRTMLADPRRRRLLSQTRSLRSSRPSSKAACLERALTTMVS